MVIQIEEITAQQIDRDKMLDEFGLAIDTRISEWKVLYKYLIKYLLENKRKHIYIFVYFCIYLYIFCIYLYIFVYLHYLCYKSILDEKDMEIAHLKQSVSQSLMQSVTSAKEENKSQIIHLNDEIARRDAIIVELQTKLSDAIVEINESAAFIEKLKAQETQE